MIHVGSELVGREIEISPVEPGSASPHTHTDVRERQIGDATLYAAVFPSLIAGEYLLEDPRGGPSEQVTVNGGRVSQLDWRTPPSEATPEPQ